MKRSSVLVLLLALALTACGSSPVPTTFTFVGFEEHFGDPLVVRILDGDEELPGSRQVAPVQPNGTATFQFNLEPEVPYRFQYFIDSNRNGVWDGPVNEGEHSWDREVTAPRPLRNGGGIEVTLGHSTNHQPLPEEFTAP